MASTKYTIHVVVDIILNAHLAQCLNRFLIVKPLECAFNKLGTVKFREVPLTALLATAFCSLGIILSSWSSSGDQFKRKMENTLIFKVSNTVRKLLHLLMLVWDLIKQLPQPLSFSYFTQQLKKSSGNSIPLK